MQSQLNWTRSVFLGDVSGVISGCKRSSGVWV
jgi:hypothetical protein